MLSKCANPSCAGSFRYLHEGKMFHLFVDLGTGKSITTHGPSRVERFWLCDRCSRTLTLVLRRVGGAVPIQVEVVASGGDRNIPASTQEHSILTEERRVFASLLPGCPRLAPRF
jgi:hypothetical protein